MPACHQYPALLRYPTLPFLPQGHRAVLPGRYVEAGECILWRRGGSLERNRWSRICKQESQEQMIGPERLVEHLGVVGGLCRPGPSISRRICIVGDGDMWLGGKG